MKPFRLLALSVLLVSAPLPGQQSEPEEPGEEEAQSPDFSREALRGIFFEIEEEPPDPRQAGIKLFEFVIGGSRTTVRFLPLGMPLGIGSGVEINPIVNPLDMTGTAGSTISPRLRNRYTEWWISRRLGFPLSPPKEN
ncbi:MAG TPA: hypothetical protein VMS56_05080 [Thermoanaerobaculia bacterium]|nr:hypothetical protein [Thermoanaerobaculia bacterium]